MSNQNPQMLALTNSIFSKLKFTEGFEDSLEIQSKNGVLLNQNSNDGNAVYKGFDYSDRLNENAFLPIGAASTIDKTILQAVTAEARIYNDLSMAGCKESFDFGTYNSVYASSNLAEQPNVAMDFATTAGQESYQNTQQSLSDYKQIIVPMPLTYYNWDISKRMIAAASNKSSMFGGFNINTQEIRVKTEGIADARERIIWYGNSRLQINGTPLYGILTHPKVVEEAAELTLSTSSPAQFITDVLNEMITPISVKNYSLSQFYIYYSQALVGSFFEDYSFQAGFQTETLDSRLGKMPGVVKTIPTPWLNVIKLDGTVDTLNGKMVLIKMTPNVIDVAIESEIAVAQYANTPMVASYCMFSACAPRIKEDYNGKVGIQYATVEVTS